MVGPNQLVFHLEIVDCSKNQNQIKQTNFNLSLIHI